MNQEEAIEFADRLIFQQTGQRLNTLQTTIIRELWLKPKLNYINIGSANGYSYEYIKQVGQKLWATLTTALGERVNRANFKVVFERRWTPQLPISPPIIETSEYDPNFVGRESAIADLNTLIEQGKKAILIQAEGGVGKTTLAWRYLKTQSFDLVLPLYMAKERQNITSVESAIEEWLKRYFNEEPGREFGISLDRLRQKLADDSQKIGILIDNLEPALENGKFISEHRQYAEFLRMLTHPAVQSVTLITSREPIHEEGIFIELYPLKELSEAAWNQYLKNCHINTGYDPLNNSSFLCQMHQAYGGNAEAMFILSGAIKTDCEGDLEAYWQENYEDLLIHPTLENLVKSQFDKLQQDNQQAYQLLCRLGCYRYQDVPRVLKEGVFALLWDVPEVRHKRVVKALEYRSLVKVCNQEYFLHPVIRSEAIERLRASEDWEKTNRQAAEFWTDSVKTVETVEDALTAFEAYYHYVEIGDFDRASAVIIKRRDFKLGNDEHLGRSFYRLGLLEQMIGSINFIKNDIATPYYLASIYNILGNIYWITGKLKESIECHNKYLDLCKLHINSASNLRSEFELLTYKSLFNLNLCHIDLWDLEKSLNYLEQLENFENTMKKQDYITLWNRWFCLAFLKASLGFREEASVIAEKTSRELGKTLVDSWSRGYSFLFLGKTYTILDCFDKAFQMYNSAISFAQESHYTQVKAKALTGLAELYRQQGEFETALSHHSESIEILNKIGAKCDLAEAYYQLGLTYQKIGETQNSQENFNKAIQLYHKIDAPKQVEKVQRAMNSTG